MSKGKVLILDDSEIILEATRLTLEEAGYTVLTLDSPFTLFETIQRERPDVLLLDVNMPALRGDKVMEISKGFGTLAGTPVLFYSTLEDAELDALAHRFGADGFIRKSLDRTVLLAQVEQWVARSRAGRSSP